MNFTLAKKPLCISIFFLLTAVLFFSCQKTLDYENSGGSIQPPDLTTKVSSSVSGFVTDENDAAVMGATVLVGSGTVTTDKYGYFEAKNVQVVKEAAVVTVNKPGYFKGIKTYIAKEGKSAFFRIKLIPKTIAGTVNSTSGGTVTLANGLSIKLNAGTIVNASTNAQYNGSVNVIAYWINPTAADLNSIMPGDLRGLNTEGSLKILQTFGMAAVELTGSSGEPLQIVNGQKATLTFPIPSSISSSAPASIPLWYFDETNGLWKQEGSATKTGNTYVGDVSHFSFWNCDVPANYVQFDCTLKDPAGNPLGFIPVKLTVAGTNNSRWAYTDSSGFVGGLVPANSNLLLEVLSAPGGCTLYSQTFVTTTVNISLGIITVSLGPNIFPVLNGTVTNCTNMPVTNGYIMVLDGNNFYRHTLNNNGAFNFVHYFCALPQTITLIAEDISNSQQSANISYVVNAGTNNVGNIQACGTSTQQFINYTINGTPYSFTYPADTFNYFNNNQTSLTLSASDPTYIHYVDMGMANTGLAVGSSQLLQRFNPSQPKPDSLLITTPITANITEYGPVGQYIGGNFTGTFTGKPPNNTQYNVTCTFRLRRTN